MAQGFLLYFISAKDFPTRLSIQATFIESPNFSVTPLIPSHSLMSLLAFSGQSFKTS